MKRATTEGDYDVEKVSEIQSEAFIESCQYICNKYSISTIKVYVELMPIT
jgi:hypothetical protein